MKMKPVIMVSACLLGVKCRYDGGAKVLPDLREKLKNCTIIAFCPELSGGLVAPRPPAEIAGGDGAAVLAGQARVKNQEGLDVTPEFVQGAEKILEKARIEHPKFLLFKANSPSCGAGQIYDGSFTGKFRPGDGVTVALLRQNGFTNIFTELDFEDHLGQILEAN
jgi:uncharacterized protein YbbK (DUF523 family)